jgi:hypothetical protein
MATTTTSAELSLINDSEFLEELQQSDLAPGDAMNRVSDSRLLSHDPYASLDRGLPMRAGASAVEAPIYVDEPPQGAFAPYDDPVPAPLVPEAPGISMVTAAIVIVACLTAGAATAAYVFQDSLTRITALRSASR